MISFTENTKNQYKAYERQFSVYGNLYLAEKRLSKNLLDESNYMNLYNLTYNNGIFEQVEAGQSNSPEIQIQAFQNNTYIANLGSKPINLGVVKFSFLKTNEFNEIRYKVNDSLQDTVVKFDISDLENNKTYYIGATFTNITQGTISWENMYISEEDIDYEEYGTMVNDYGSENATSKNIFNSYKNIYYKKSLFDVNFINSNQIKCICNDTTDNNKYILYDLDTNKILGKKIYFSAYFESTSLYPQVYLFARNNGSLISLKGVYPSNVNKGKVIFDYTFPENMPSGYDNYVIGFYGRRAIRNNAQIGDYTIYSDIMIGESDIYERYNSSPFRLDEENECKILEFNINEKTDIYYTSLPYNSMTIEVDNEKGYFTVEDENSILEYLNNECYVDLFIKINNEDYYKIKTMNFVAINYSDYEKAKLEFNSCVLKINNNNILYDKYKQFLNSRLSYSNLQNYLLNNYNINLLTDHDYYNIDDSLSIRLNSDILNDLKSIVINSSTRLGLANEGSLIINDYNDNLKYKKISNIVMEIITQNLQLEKPIIKKDNIYKNIKYTYHENVEFEETNLSYSRSISYKLKSKYNIIIYRDNDYKLSEITQNDITFSSTASVELITTQNNDFILIFVIQGNIGDEINININKTNIKRKKETSILTYRFKTDYNNDDKTLIIENENYIASGIYDFIYIKKPILNYIEAKIIGLPYLEVGDTINVQLENMNKKIVLTYIDTNFNGGITQTIKGYELDWTHQAEYPYDDLNNWT